jgi:uncharacterized membrane protein YccC
MSTSSPTAAPPGAWAPWRAAALDWWRNALPNWVYIAKTVGAALLCLWLAMRLDLAQPRTAMTTVFIVMQPYSGAVLAKSFYRLAGTLVGSLVSLALVALFAQQPTVLLACTFVWIGICTAGATRNRNFRSYAFVLAGYTAALVAIPTLSHPQDIFDAAVTRLTEVSLGVLVSTAISALVLPRFAGAALPQVVRARFTGFVEFIADSLAGRIDRAGIEARNLHFVADVVNLEATRSIAVFEHPEVRLRSALLTRLNHDFMAVSTRLHALHQLLNRLRTLNTPGVNAVLVHFEPYLREIAPCLSPAAEPVLRAADARGAAQRLARYRAALRARIQATRKQVAAALPNDAHAPALLLDFDTAAELLARFVDELQVYTDSYAALGEPGAQAVDNARAYVPKTGAVASAVSGLRAVLILLVAGAFWYATAWPGGELMAIMAGTSCAIAATAADPLRVVKGLLFGSLLALPAGAVCTFLLYPRIDGFALLCCALTPFLVLGLAASLQPRWAGVGVGFLIFFCFGAGPDNVVHYDPAAFFNNMLAVILACTLAAVAFSVFLPPTGGWWLARIVRELRQQVVLACSARRTGLSERFEGGARDLIQQAGVLNAERADAQQVALSWMFVVLEIGHAVIELRDETAALDAVRKAATRPPAQAQVLPLPLPPGWREQLRATCAEVAKLFDRPTMAQRIRTLQATQDVIAAMQTGLRDCQAQAAPEHRAALVHLQRIVTYLHFIRSALLDRTSPLPGGARFEHATHDALPHATVAADIELPPSQPAPQDDAAGATPPFSPE